MTNAKSNFFYRTFAAGAVLAGAMLVSQSAMACTLDNWSANNGAVVAGDPSAGGGSIARYAGFCGMQVDGNGYVQDNNPGGIDRIVARFYVLNTNTGTAEIYAGYGDTAGGSERFNVTLDNAGTVTLTDTATGQSVQQSGSTGWLSVEVDWAQGAGNGVISLSVNGQAVSENDTLSNTGTPLQSVRLGSLGAAAGTMNFDAYESRRSTAVGRICRGDADGSGIRNITDLQTLFTEVQTLGGTLASGTPDINEDGLVGIPDLQETFNFIQNLQGDCVAFPG